MLHSIELGREKAALYVPIPVSSTMPATPEINTRSKGKSKTLSTSSPGVTKKDEIRSFELEKSLQRLLSEQKSKLKEMEDRIINRMTEQNQHIQLSLQQHLDNLTATIDNMNVELTNVKHELAELQLDTSSAKTHMNQLDLRANKVESAIEMMKLDINNQKKEYHAGGASAPQDTVKEIINQLERRNNLILFGLKQDQYVNDVFQELEIGSGQYTYEKVNPAKEIHR